MSIAHRHRWLGLVVITTAVLSMVAIRATRALAEPKSEHPWYSAACQHQVCLLVLDESSDADGDGVSDADEAVLETDPNDLKSTPSVIDLFDRFIGRGLPSFDKHLTEIVVLPVMTEKGDALSTFLGDISLGGEGVPFIDTTNDLLTGLSPGHGSFFGIAGTRDDLDPENAVAAILGTDEFGALTLGRGIGAVTWDGFGDTGGVSFGDVKLTATGSTKVDGGNVFEFFHFDYSGADGPGSANWNQCLECDGEDPDDGGTDPGDGGGPPDDGGTDPDDGGGTDPDDGGGTDPDDGGGTDPDDGGGTDPDDGGGTPDDGNDPDDGGGTDPDDGGGTPPDDGGTPPNTPPDPFPDGDSFDDHWDGDEWHDHPHPHPGGDDPDWDKYGNPDYVEVRISPALIEEAFVRINSLRDPVGGDTGDTSGSHDFVDERGWYVYTTDEGVTTISSGTPPVTTTPGPDYGPDNYGGLYGSGGEQQPSSDANPYTHHD